MNNLTYYLECASSVMVSHAHLDNVFTDSELTQIESICDNLDMQEGLAYGKNSDTVRKSKIGWIKLNDNTVWLFDKFGRALSQVNKDFFRYDLSGIDHNAIQYTVYDSEGSNYDWHTDLMFNDKFSDLGLIRKLSCSFILSDSSEYQGGEFETGYSYSYPDLVEQKRNRMIVFSSFMPHRVRPIIAGKRRSLVIWLVGPRFK